MFMLFCWPIAILRQYTFRFASNLIRQFPAISMDQRHKSLPPVSWLNWTTVFFELNSIDQYQGLWEQDCPGAFSRCHIWWFVVWLQWSEGCFSLLQGKQTIEDSQCVAAPAPNWVVSREALVWPTCQFDLRLLTNQCTGKMLFMGCLIMKCMINKYMIIKYVIMKYMINMHNS